MLKGSKLFQLKSAKQTSDAFDMTFDDRTETWFTRNLSSREIKDRLSDQPLGSFIVNFSSSHDLALHVCSGVNSVTQCKVLKINDKYILGRDTISFSSLYDLVRHYSSHKSFDFPCLLLWSAQTNTSQGLNNVDQVHRPNIVSDDAKADQNNGESITVAGVTTSQPDLSDVPPNVEPINQISAVSSSGEVVIHFPPPPTIL
jgi:hypothetical protein